MDEEINALLENRIQTPTPVKPNIKVVDCKWVFQTKRKPDSTIDRRKVFLVAKGYNQQQGVEYGETFNHVIKSSTVSLVLTIALQH